MNRKEVDEVTIEGVVEKFEYIANNVASHVNVKNENIYPQPNVYITSHLICMQAAGWKDIDFDTIAAVSGASALFAYENYDTFMPKYACLYIGMDERIANATGFGFEWAFFDGPDKAWDILRIKISAGIPVKGWCGENVIFAGYLESPKRKNRKIFVMSDGAEYFIEWYDWKKYCKWVRNWKNGQLGYFAGVVEKIPEEKVAVQVIRDLVNWSENPPETVKEKFPKAKFGFSGIKAYAGDCADVKKYKDWRACHDINPQWTVRNSTAVYLKKLVEKAIFTEQINNALLSASEKYKNAYLSWREFYNLLGQAAPENAGKDKQCRRDGADAVLNALEHEKQAVTELREIQKLI